MASQLLDLVVGDALAERLVHQLAVCFLLADIVTVNEENGEAAGRLVGDIIGAGDKHVGVGRVDTGGENLGAVGDKSSRPAVPRRGI